MEAVLEIILEVSVGGNSPDGRPVPSINSSPLQPEDFCDRAEARPLCSVSAWDFCFPNFAQGARV